MITSEARHKADIMFRTEYNGQTNFMTPSVIERGMTGTLAWELSGGRGFKREPIWGVTVLQDCDGTTRRTELSEMFFSEADARAHIESLKGAQ